MRTWLTVTIVLITFTAASAQDAYKDHRDPPDAPGVQRIQSIVDAFNSGDADAIEACLDEHFTGRFTRIPLERHLEAWQGVRSQWGPVEYEAVRVYDPPRDDLVVILRAPALEAWRALIFGVGERGRFTGMQFAPARPPSYLEASEPLSVEEAAARITNFVDRLAGRDMFSGAVVITQGGRPLVEKAAGLASRRFEAPNRLDTKFNLGSMNKMFTAVAIGQLVDSGRLSFNDTVGDHLPDYPNQEVRERVRIKHLLSHTSGMGSHFTDEFMESSKLRYRDFKDYLPLFEDEPLAFDPGSDWSYSNAGFFVLGLVIEAVSGQSYYDYVREHIYKPADMTNTDAYDMDIPIKNLAVGYTRRSPGSAGDDGARWMDDVGGLRNNYFLHSIKGGPAGGGFSTAPDLIRFAGALLDGRLLSPAMREILTTPKPELNSPEYGYGFAIEEHERLGRAFGHSGGFPGVAGHLQIFPERRLVVAVLANLDGAAGAVSRRFAELVEVGP